MKRLVLLGLVLFAGCRDAPTCPPPKVIDCTVHYWSPIQSGGGTITFPMPLPPGCPP